MSKIDLDAIGSTLADIEGKAKLRHIATPEGARRFGGRIGDVIDADGNVVSKPDSPRSSGGKLPKRNSITINAAPSRRPSKAKPKKAGPATRKPSNVTITDGPYEGWDYVRVDGSRKKYMVGKDPRTGTFIATVGEDSWEPVFEGDSMNDVMRQISRAHASKPTPRPKPKSKRTGKPAAKKPSSRPANAGEGISDADFGKLSESIMTRTIPSQNALLESASDEQIDKLYRTLIRSGNINHRTTRIAERSQQQMYVLRGHMKRRNIPEKAPAPKVSAPSGWKREGSTSSGAPFFGSDSAPGVITWRTDTARWEARRNDYEPPQLGGDVHRQFEDIDKAADWLSSLGPQKDYRTGKPVSTGAAASPQSSHGPDLPGVTFGRNSGGSGYVVQPVMLNGKEVGTVSWVDRGGKNVGWVDMDEDAVDKTVYPTRAEAAQSIIGKKKGSPRERMLARGVTKMKGGKADSPGGAKRALRWDGTGAKQGTVNSSASTDGSRFSISYDSSRSKYQLTGSVGGAKPDLSNVHLLGYFGSVRDAQKHASSYNQGNA